MRAIIKMDLKKKQSKAKMIYSVFVEIRALNHKAGSVNIFRPFTGLDNTVNE